jgi:hypothetical protein
VPKTCNQLIGCRALSQDTSLDCSDTMSASPDTLCAQPGCAFSWLLLLGVVNAEHNEAVCSATATCCLPDGTLIARSQSGQTLPPEGLLSPSVFSRNTRYCWRWLLALDAWRVLRRSPGISLLERRSWRLPQWSSTRRWYGRRNSEGKQKQGPVDGRYARMDHMFQSSG